MTKRDASRPENAVKKKFPESAEILAFSKPLQRNV
jgi:hypothetical protein